MARRLNGYTLNTMEFPTHTDVMGDVPQSGVPAFGLIEDQLGQVKELINEQLSGSAKTEETNRLLKYVNVCSGKMIRPGLVLLSGMCCGGITDDHIHVAAIVEMMHSATLLHDDVIDEGQKRRGLPTVNSLWGNEFAVLLGDFVLSQVFKMCSDLQPKITNIIAAIAARTCEGEMRQIIERQNWQLSESEYIDIISEKSAVFFSNCSRLGAILAQASDADVKSLACFALNAGIAFQITDDLLDIIGDESRTGKTAGSDVDKNKLTLATIHLLREVDETEKPAIINQLDVAHEGQDVLVQMLRSYGSLEYAQNRAHEFVDKAVQALAGFKQSDAKEGLIETARFMANRAI
jgi:octaprenyl-diphosphate synthase